MHYGVQEKRSTLTEGRARRPSGPPCRTLQEKAFNLAAASRRMPTIVVGVDFSQPSRKALDQAIALATALRAGLVMVHARPALPRGAKAGALDPITQVRQEVDDEEARILSTQWAAQARAGVQQLDVVERRGKAGEVVVAEARSRGAAYIVVGSRGRGGFAKAVLGSVASDVLASSPVPVVVVPA